jgi:hypothetical protein
VSRKNIKTQKFGHAPTKPRKKERKKKSQTHLKRSVVPRVCSDPVLNEGVCQSADQAYLTSTSVPDP